MEEQNKHVLIPKHEKLSDKEKEELLKKLECTFKDLPKILSNDASIKNLNVKEGDVIKITRKTEYEDTIFYRGVLNA